MSLMKTAKEWDAVLKDLDSGDEEDTSQVIPNMQHMEQQLKDMLQTQLANAPKTDEVSAPVQIDLKRGKAPVVDPKA